MIKQDSIFFHEDDYCQIELLPIQNRFTIQKHEKQIKDGLIDNYNENGFENIYSREQIKCSLTRENINAETFEGILKKNALGYFNNVYSGYSSEKFYKDKTHAFYYENYTFFYEKNENIIDTAWINYSLISDTLNIYPIRLEHTLIELGNMFNLIIVDWNEIITIDLKDIIAITNYIEQAL